MIKMTRLALAAVCIAAALCCLSCAKETVRDNGAGNVEPSYSDLGLEKKFLEEGFITDDLYRVVMITPADAAMDLEALKTRAANRARVSLERCLTSENIQSDRNIQAAILILIERNGSLIKKEIEHKRYNVFYFDIARKNMMNYFKGMASQR